MSGLVSHRFPLEQINEAFATLRDKPDGFVKAVISRSR
jgi:threonine dehydrogenase-like Zn-dependent dehydrogenase